MAQSGVGTPLAASSRPAGRTQAALAVWIGLSALVAIFAIGAVAFLSRDGWLETPERAASISSVVTAPVVSSPGAETPAVVPAAAAAAGPEVALALVVIEAAPQAAVTAAPKAEVAAAPGVVVAPVAFVSEPAAPPDAPPDAPPVAAQSQPAPQRRVVPTTAPARQVVPYVPQQLAPAPAKPSQPVAPEPVPAAQAPAKPVMAESKRKSEFIPPTPRPAQPTKAAFVPPSS